MENVPRDEIRAHVSRFQELLRANSIDSTFILQGADMFYLSGAVQDGVLCVPSEGEPAVFVRRSFARAEAEVSFGKVVRLNRYSELPSLVSEAGIELGSVVGIEKDVLPVGVFERLKKHFPQADFVDVSKLILMCRAVKTDYEKSMLRKTGEIACEVFNQIPGMIRPGMAEFELAAEIQRASRLAGHQGAFRIRRWIANSFTDPIVSGASACITSFFDGPVGSQGQSPAMPIGAGDKSIMPKEPIMVDLVIGYGGYHVDLTRVFAIDGLSDELKDAHNVAREIIHKVESMLKAGINTADVYMAAMSIAESSPFKLGFMGVPGSNVGFVGHGIGLEVDELPVLAGRSDMELIPSHVLAVEPKFFFEALGGVGLENTYIVGENSCENLTPLKEEIVFV
ncbi:aminopeptidase P family protein [bacterium]|nr:aminopeptidase P family protein [bacterium]